MGNKEILYCNTWFDGFAMTKDGEIRLYDMSALLEYSCENRTGLNPYSELGKGRSNLINKDSYGLSISFDTFFYD